MKCLVTGGAGFIGSHLVDRLVARGEVTVFDNFSSGKREFLAGHSSRPGFRILTGDLLDASAVREAVNGQDMVFHLAANPDLRRGATEPGLDFQQGTVASFQLLEAMRAAGVQRIAFASSSAIYGLNPAIPTPEDYGPLLPISNYGASKLACEGLVSAYAHNFGTQAWVFRFANIVGGRATHGVLRDFTDKLRSNPSELRVLGDGTQSKSYLSVTDCVDAMLFCVDHAEGPVNVYNLGSEDRIDVLTIARIVIEEMKLANVNLLFTGGRPGWPGDVPDMRLDVSRLGALGWRASRTSAQAVREAVRSLLAEP